MEIKDITVELKKMAEAITGRLVIEDLIKEAVKVCHEILKADACSIYLIDRDNPDVLVMKASIGYTNDLTGTAKYELKKTSQEKKLGITASIAITGEPIVTKSRMDFSDSDKCPEYSGGRYDEKLWGKEDKEKCQSFFGAPLKTSDRIFGVFKVESHQKEFFDEERQGILLIIASMITSSIQNLRVIELFHASFKEIGESPTETKKLYNELAKKCAELVHAESSSIFIPNEKGRLVLRGDYGHEKSFVDCEEDKYTYAPGEGVTGTVFQTGEPSSVSADSHHTGKLYPMQFRKEHICHSWYQFPLGKYSPFLGVMKIENKLGIDKKPIETGGFNESDKKILEILANSVVPLIAMAKIKARDDRSRRALDEIGRTTNINEIFSPDLLKKIENLKKIRNQKLHQTVIIFINKVKSSREKEEGADYLDIAKQHIYTIGNALGINTDFLEYCESLEFYEPILYQLQGYRAHFVHQLNVFLNGYLILNWLDDSQFEKIKGVIATKCKENNKNIDVFKIWFTTTIFHDTGYPLGKVGDWTQTFIIKIFKESLNQIAPAIVETLAFRLYREICRESLNLLIHYLSIWLELDEIQKKNLRHEIHEQFFKNLPENLIPGLLLIKAAEKLLKQDVGTQNIDIDKLSSIDKCMLSTAISAIVLDDEKIIKHLKKAKLKEQVFYTDHPLAFLLVYCDNIQEYGRPKSVVDELPQVDEFAVKKQELSCENATINCKLVYNKKPAIWDNKVKPILESIKKYWKSPSDLTFSISYLDEDKEEFDNLTFLKGPPSSC